jgi:hypothetical protein
VPRPPLAATSRGTGSSQTLDNMELGARIKVELRGGWLGHGGAVTMLQTVAAPEDRLPPLPALHPLDTAGPYATRAPPSPVDPT